MTINANPSYVPTQITSTTLIKTGQGVMGRIFVSAASSTPTITVYNNVSGTTNKVVDTFTPVAATTYSFDAAFDVGLNVVISGTVSCTVLWV